MQLLSHAIQPAFHNASSIFQVVEDGLSASKPGLVTGAAARLVTEMANIDQVCSSVSSCGDSITLLLLNHSLTPALRLAC